MLARAQIFVLVLFLIILSTMLSIAQENIITTRPTSSMNTYTIPSNTFQFEQGFSYIGDTIVSDGFFRASLSDIVELRIQTFYETKDLYLSTKWNAMKADEYKPGLAFNLTFASDLQVFGYTMSIEQKLSDRLTGFLNLGEIEEGYFGDVTIGITLTEKIGTFVDAFVHEGFQKYSTGITYLINNDTQIDINGGVLTNTTSDYSIGIGFARRFNFKDSQD